MRALAFVTLLLSLPAFGFEITAHRGMYPPFAPNYRPDPHDCTAQHIDDPSRRPEDIRFTLENSLPAIDKAFEKGADRVSINLQLTRDGEVVLFHDREMKCKTDHAGKIRDYDLKDLQTFNMGAGYRFEGTYPWRDENVVRRGYTRITTLDELMSAHGDRAYWIVIRPESAEELAAILRKLRDYPDAVKRSTLFVPAPQPWVSEIIRNELPESSLARVDLARNTTCRNAFVPGLALPETCRDLDFVMQASDAIARGPALRELGKKLHQLGSRLLIGTEQGGLVETIDQARALAPYRSVIDGMMTSRIDLIAPLVRE